ncbi:T9SS type A sorting domain-containing protein [Hymenobacter sp. UYAg731]
MTGRRDAAVLAATQEAPAAEVLVYPNPTAADRIDVVITANREQAATVQLHDLTGRLVHQETVRLYNGSNELRLGVKKTLPAGIYQLSVPEFHVSQKVAVQ